VSALSVIEIGIDPTFELGPVTLAWHGITIAVGIVVGSLLAARYARQRGLVPGEVYNAVALIVLAGIIGARFFYLLLNDVGALLRPADWLGSNGFAIYGGLLFGAVAAAVYLRKARLSPRYLDAFAFGLLLGLAVGRIGDVINGEHYGPPSSVPWAIQNVHPDADVPSATVAYHSGGFYEVLLGLAILAVVLLLRDRLRRPTMLLWMVIALYGAGRFFMFFYRSDTDALAIGINAAQAVSLGFVVAAALGALWARRQYPSVDQSPTFTRAGTPAREAT